MSGLIDQHHALKATLMASLARTRPDADVDTLQFLAVGEYTFNYRLRLAGIEAVLRVITGSQMGLEVSEQARYEAGALRLLAETGRTPTLLDVETAAPELDYPYLLITYLSGRPLNYRADLVAAAQCVSEIHRLPIPREHSLQRHGDPAASIFSEVDRLLGSEIEYSVLGNLVERVRCIPGEELAAVQTDQAVINTDLNSHNFIVDGGRAWLIDWEKARIGPTLMDLAHFLLPTTTLWREETATRLSFDQQEEFISAYLDARPEVDRSSYRFALRTAMQLAALRAVAWCAWAVAESQRGDRAIVNAETLAKCQLFTSHDFLQDLEAELWG